MSNALMKRESLSVEQITALAVTLSKSTLLPTELHDKAANVMFSIMTGAELGLSPMASIRAIHVIKGKPVLAADAMLAVVLSRGAAECFELVESTEEKATYRTKRVGSKNEVVYTYTIDDAKKAQLVKDDSGWVKHPKNMLRARCISMLARIVYPDLLMGIYTPEEIHEAENDNVQDAEFVEKTVVAGALPPAEEPDDPRIPPILAALEVADTTVQLGQISTQITALKLNKKGRHFETLRLAFRAADERVKALTAAPAAPAATEAA